MSLPPEDLQAELRAGVQPERTSLAWSRTLLTLAAAVGLVGVHGYVSDVTPTLSVAAMSAAGLTLLLGSPISRRRLATIHRSITELGTVPAAGPTLALTAVTALVAVVGLIAITNPSW